MPNRGGYRSNTNETNRFHSFLNRSNEHDNRGNNKDSTKGIRRVRFKHNRKNEISEHAAHARLEEDDTMSFELSKYGGGFRRKGSPVPAGKFNKLNVSDFGWYQVTIHGGHRYSRDDVVRELLNALHPMVFMPCYWRIEKNSIVFYLEDYTVAEKLKFYEKPIQMNDGFRLHLRVRDGFPYITVDDNLKQKIALAMTYKYDRGTKCMDLSCFHKDPNFKSEFCALIRPNVMSAVLNIMTEFTPDVEILNLSQNFLTNLEGFKNTSTRLPKLKTLYLDNNKIMSLANLLVLRDMKLVELTLMGNPLRNRFKEQKFYISEVRRKFPQLKKLDGAELLPLVSLDSYQGKLPKSHASCLIQESAASMLQTFLSQYFLIFDSENRQPLLDAYHEKALMSISVAPASQAGRLSSFWKYNRNLKRLVANDSQTRNMKIGPLAIVSTLAEWPRVIHDKSSFTVDLTFISDEVVIFTVTGLFQEVDTSPTATNGNIRTFARTYFLLRTGNTLAIRNELIYISNATQAQSKSFMKKSVGMTEAQNSTMTNMQAATNIQSRLQPGASADAMYLPNAMSQINLNGASTSAAAMQLPNAINQININQASTSGMQLPLAVQGNINENATSNVANIGIPDDATKIRMVHALHEKSKMNFMFCEKCLSENQWDFDTACHMFEKAYNEGRIPPDAFKLS
ncbi:nuclear RNA export factor 1 [Teleopsis dalmanni]|uniref:nuclear RNA export factor 1 n=1 Tax=Teleopsis dalmanni TaxID=139649 RepID=UPI0018CD9100|nr:nuclear RNA export factor 1 [Teleopsis dalmanni]